MLFEAQQNEQLAVKLDKPCGLCYSKKKLHIDILRGRRKVRCESVTTAITVIGRHVRKSEHSPRCIGYHPLMKHFWAEKSTTVYCFPCRYLLAGLVSVNSCAFIAFGSKGAFLMG